MTLTGYELKKDTISRIKVAAPVTMVMLTFLFDRIILMKRLEVITIQWFLATLAFFAVSTLITASLMYYYKLSIHSCNSCGKQWVKVRSKDILISSLLYKISLLKWHAFLDVRKIVKVYNCKLCSSVQHKKARQLLFLGIKKQ